MFSEGMVSRLDHCKKYLIIFNTVLSFVNDVTYSGRAAHAIVFSVVRVWATKLLNPYNKVKRINTIYYIIVYICLSMKANERELCKILK